MDLLYWVLLVTAISNLITAIINLIEKLKTSKKKGTKKRRVRRKRK